MFGSPFPPQIRPRLFIVAGIIVLSGWAAAMALVPSSWFAEPHIVVLRTTKSNHGLVLRMINDGTASGPVYGGWVVTCPHHGAVFARWGDTPRWIKPGSLVIWTEPWPPKNGTHCAIAITLRMGLHDAGDSVRMMSRSGHWQPVPKYERLDPGYRSRR